MRDNAGSRGDVGGEKLKGRISVISSDPPCKNGNARFTMIPLQRFTDKKCGRYRRFSDSKNVKL